MAARQDQGLQIALIILIFLFILSAVAAYIGWKSYSESEQRVEAQKTSSAKRTSRAATIKPRTKSCAR